jgi:hypothetical protein
MDKPKGFRCQACGAEFDTREQLQEHGRKEHKKESKPGAAGRVEPPRRGGAE